MFEAIAIITAFLASLTTGSEVEPPSPVPVVQEEVIGEAPFVPQVSADDPYVDTVSEDGGLVLEPTDGIAGDGSPTILSDGWITSPYSGRLVCVTGAPCELDEAFTGPDVSSYNWITGEVN